jgi:hypothetical protein
MRSREYFRYFFHESTIVGLFGQTFPERKRAFEAEYANRYGSYAPYREYLGLASEIAVLSDGMMFVGELLLTRHIALQQLDRRLEQLPSNPTGRARLRLLVGGELDAFTDLKRSALDRLTEIEMLSESFLWGPVPDLGGMFNHDGRRENVDRTIESLESTIRDQYNRRTQSLIVILTAATVLLATPWVGILSFLQTVVVALLDSLPALPW